MKTPDIEIYVKNADMAVIKNWLEESFSAVQLPQHSKELFDKGKAIKAYVENNSAKTELIITPRAAGKTFCSIWFKQNITNWENDESCAHSLLSKTDIEIRCSASGWSEEEDEQSAQWLLLTRDERKLINWG
jgi:hypothetical protein